MPTDPPSPAQRFASVVDWLVTAIARRSDWRLGPRQLPGPVILLVALRLRRLASRFAGLLARLQAGALPPPGAARRRPGPLRPTGPRKPPAWLPPGAPAHLLRRKAWVLRLASTEAAQGGAYLFNLLGDPGMAALIEAEPLRTGRVLRPLCRMLGVDPPPILRLPPRPGKPRPVAPNPPPAQAAPAGAIPSAPLPPPAPLRPLHPRFRPPRWMRRSRGPPPICA